MPKAGRNGRIDMSRAADDRIMTVYPAISRCPSRAELWDARPQQNRSETGSTRAAPGAI